MTQNTTHIVRTVKRRPDGTSRTDEMIVRGTIWDARRKARESREAWRSSVAAGELSAVTVSIESVRRV